MMKDHYPQMAAQIGKSELVRDVAELLRRSTSLRAAHPTAWAGGRGRVLSSPGHVSRKLPRASQSGAGDGPLRLLQSVRGIDLVPSANLEQCCGFGGTFAVKNAEVSSAMLAEKTTAS